MISPVLKGSFEFCYRKEMGKVTGDIYTEVIDAIAEVYVLSK